ncbi:L-aspartate oxidase [Arthrobacter sp. VKM Ac-2550]|uniref:L-aspartate oxidase n=1 Tax=Crystallibacter permensis TaxID=1938888 RepID=UPI002225FF3F|nr:L-aspartate oxidase [Arthrobacter sp. VKM Ac-2550]MCW2135129.1 L-aspartate oxidase [Arthrobacter sp. VKM Ac-2550]
MNTRRRTGSRRIVVVGSGIAGLYAAALAAEDPDGHQVTLVTKGALAQSNTWFAQGGITAVTGQGEAAGDSVGAHVADTLRAGAEMNDDDAVRLLCAAAGAEIDTLLRWGVPFDRKGTLLALGLEGAHSAARILHAGGDRTGAAIAEVLINRVMSLAGAGRMELREHSFVTRLLESGGRITGVELFGAPDGDVRTQLPADVVVLATGGAGQLYEATTNPDTATGDGVALAWAAGAVLTDLEFIQFHPTLLDPAAANGTAFMISEAVRGEGALLVDSTGHRFMPDYHPDAELAPRDVVSRAICRQRLLLGSRGEAPDVYLDATGISRVKGPDFLARRFPTIHHTVTALGLDWNTQPLPVVPASHYWMGGIRTDLDGRTSVPGLFAVGEAACAGVHGANRLASNSLLEGLVFARRAVRALAAGKTPVFEALPLELSEGTTHCTRADLQQLVSSAAGVARDGATLELAAKQLGEWTVEPADQAGAEDANLLATARLVVAAARARENSVGAHYRTDFEARPAGSGRLSFVNSRAGGPGNSASQEQP